MKVQLSRALGDMNKRETKKRYKSKERHACRILKKTCTFPKKTLSKKTCAAVKSKWRNMVKSRVVGIDTATSNVRIESHNDWKQQEVGR